MMRPPSRQKLSTWRRIERPEACHEFFPGWKIFFPPRPRPIVEIVNVSPGAGLQAKAAAQGLTLEGRLRNLAGVEDSRSRKGRYSLADLVAQCDPSTPLSGEDKAWLDQPGTGQEAV